MDVVLDRVRRGSADLSGVDQRLAPLLRAALSPSAAQRPHADEVVQALDRYAAGSSSTLAVPVERPSPARLHPDPSSTQVVGPAQEQDWLAQWQPDPAYEPDGEMDRESHREADRGGPGQPDPRIGSPSVAGTLLALVVGVLGVGSIRPLVAIGLVTLWSWCARFVDRSITSLVLRRHESGRRRRDVPLAVVVSPWHAVISAVVTVLALLLPAIVAIGSTFCVALAVAAVAGGNPQPDSSLPLVAGGFLGLLMGWWGPGGASLRRGSRSLVRAVAPGKRAPGITVAIILLIGLGFGAWAWLRQGQPDWWPWSLRQLPAISSLFH
jgi:hypothetical protein